MKKMGVSENNYGTSQPDTKRLCTLAALAKVWARICNCLSRYEEGRKSMTRREREGGE
jgi:hypothetical protein